MNFKNTIIGTIVALIGIAIGYIDYYEVSKLSKWVSSLLNAPEATTGFLTLILILLFAGILIIIAVFAIVVFIKGLKILFEN